MITDQHITDLLTDAKAGIGYWASRVKIDSYAHICAVEPADGDGNVRHLLTYTQIRHTIEQIAHGNIPFTHLPLQALCQQMLEDFNMAGYDAGDADMIVQVACFGDVVYG